MLLGRLTASLVLAVGAFANPIITSGYSTQEREQIQQAHLDAVKLVRTAIGSVAQEEYDRILVKYFDIEDHQLVWSK